MANNKLLVDIDGKVKEISNSHIDTSANSLVVNKLSSSQMSVSLPDGLLSVENDKISSISAVDAGKIIVSDGDKWVSINPSSGQTISGNPQDGDLDGNYPNPIVKNLSHVQNGVLPIERGGTGRANYPSTGEVLLVGNGTSAASVINAADGVDGQALYYDGSKWTFVNQGSEGDKSINVQVFSTPGTYTWTKPANTKIIRVLAQGGGGGGGSGANRNNTVAALGGAGGGAGGFVDVTALIDTSITSGTVVVGSGGSGGIYTSTNSAGINGNSGQNSSFAIDSVTYASAYGGKGGGGGNLNSFTLSSGGSSVSGTSQIYDTVFDEKKVIISNAGASNSRAAGTNSTFSSSSTSYYGAGGGGSGGAISTNFTNFAGGNGGTSIVNSGSSDLINAGPAISSSISNILGIANPLYISSGGGGGGGAKLSQSLDNILMTLIHFEGPNGSTSATDSSIYRRTVQFFNTVAAPPISTTKYKFGTSCLSSARNTTSANYTCGLAESVYLGSGDGTIHCWINLVNAGTDTDVSQKSVIFYVSGYALCVSSTNKLNIWNNTVNNILSAGPTVTYNVWHHVALVKSGNTLYAYYDGSLAGSATITTEGTWNTFIGTNGTGLRNINGHLDEFVIVPYAMSASEILAYYSSNSAVSDPSGSDPLLNPDNFSAGGLGGNGAWGSGGGGGGASTKATSSLTTYDLETVSLIYSNTGDRDFEDKSIYRNTEYNKLSIVSNSSVGVPPINNLFSDGILSSSNIGEISSGYCSSYISTPITITDNFTIESWFYLKDYGKSRETNVSGARCYLMGDGYNFSTYIGILLGINLGTNALMIWSDGAWRGTGSTLLVPQLNTWNHMVLQKQGGTMFMYLNGVSSSIVAASTVTANTFGFSLAKSLYGDYNFIGYAKQFAVTSRVKSASEIQNYYNSVINNISGSYTNPSVGIQQGGNGGDGYVAIISYK